MVLLKIFRFEFTFMESIVVIHGKLNVDNSSSVQRVHLEIWFWLDCRSESWQIKTKSEMFRPLIGFIYFFSPKVKVSALNLLSVLHSWDVIFLDQIKLSCSFTFVFNSKHSLTCVFSLAHLNAKFNLVSGDVLILEVCFYINTSSWLRGR